MGLVDWFRHATFYGRVVREAGELRVGGVRVLLRELAPRADHRRRWLLTLRRGTLSRREAHLLLSPEELASLRELLDRGLRAPDDDRR